MRYFLCCNGLGLMRDIYHTVAKMPISVRYVAIWPRLAKFLNLINYKPPCIISATLRLIGHSVANRHRVRLGAWEEV